MKALNLIPLKPGVAPADFERFSREIDQPLLRSLPVVEGFDAYGVAESVGESAPEFAIVELMTVRSWDEWVRVRDGGDPRLAAAGERFAELADPARVTAVLLDDLDPAA